MIPVQEWFLVITNMGIREAAKEMPGKGGKGRANMQVNDNTYRAYLEILRRELVPAMGCTEPISLAYAAAKARETLGAVPDRVVAEVSGNLIKNTKSVVVPNTNGLFGIEAAVAAGIAAGDASRELEVISSVTPEQKEAIAAFLVRDIIEVCAAESGLVFDLFIHVYSGASSASVRIVGSHSNIVYIEKDGQALLEREITEGSENLEEQEKNLLSIQEILTFADICQIDDVRETLDRQIAYNTAIAEEGLKNSWGANVGSVYLKYGRDGDVNTRAIAKAAAGSDARMSGCELPVIINSGSGNQGITVSVPVIEHARAMGAPEERLYRALVVSNLTGAHLKSGLGRLSAYCGVVSAGCAAGAGIAYLHGESESVILHTIVNCLAIDSGIVCDGAKPSCAGKIVAALETAMLGYRMALEGEEFKGGEGIVKKGVENTITSVGRLGKLGMAQTDREILAIMLDRNC